MKKMEKNFPERKKSFFNAEKLQKYSICFLISLLPYYLPIYGETFRFIRGSFLRLTILIIPGTLFLGLISAWMMFLFLSLLFAANLYLMHREQKIVFDFIAMYLMLSAMVFYGAWHCEGIVMGWMSV